MTEQTSRPMMSFGQSIKTCFRKYATFKGRASRAEYWWFQLFFILPTLASLLVLSGLFLRVDNFNINDFSGGHFIIGLWGLFMFVSILPNIAVSVRRLHDSGKSGLWVLWMCLTGALSNFGGLTFFLILFIALGLFVLILYCLPSDEGTNEYSDSPAITDKSPLTIPTRKIQKAICVVAVTAIGLMLLYPPFQMVGTIAVGNEWLYIFDPLVNKAHRHDGIGRHFHKINTPLLLMQFFAVIVLAGVLCFCFSIGRKSSDK